MMDRKHLTDEDIKEAFANFAEGLRAEDPVHQLASAGMMLHLINDYLHQNIEGLDTTAILMVLARACDKTKICIIGTI